MFGLKQSDIAIIEYIGKANPGLEKILIYGSRARGNHKKGSDVDLALVGKLEGTALWRIRDLLNEVMPTPYFYDVVHLDTLKDSPFKERIIAEGQPIYTKLSLDVYDLLVKMKERPGMYFGELSLTALDNYLGGYCHSHYDLGVKFIPAWEMDFNTYIERYYNLPRSSMTGLNTIKEHTKNEEEAFYKFFELLEGYRAMKEKEFRILSPTAILGYGFPAASFEEGMKRKPHVIAVDAGSTDPGPYYLGSGKSFTDRGAVKRDLEFMLTAATQNGIPLIIGSAGGAGADSHLEWNVDIIREIAHEKKLSFKAAIISSQLSADVVMKNFDAGKVKELHPAPMPTAQHITDSTNIVAQMGEAPFIEALDADAQVIIAGRSYDPVVFAAPAIRAGFDAGLALHMGKILECAAIAAYPGSGSDCMLGILREDHFELNTLNPIRKCTITSVAAHTLYEKSDPTSLPGPGGRLDLRQTTFEQAGEGVIVRGSKFVADEGLGFVKLEAARLVGKRTLSIAATVDPIMISQLDNIITEVKNRVTTNFEGIGDFHLDFKTYGANGASFYTNETPSRPQPEIAIVIEAVANTKELSETICSFARSTLLHFGYEGRKSTAGNLAFPFSPSDFSGGDVYEFSLYCLMEATGSMFPIKYANIKEGNWND